MKKRKVYRYYCDYCRRSFGHSHDCIDHELYCLKNPGRHCGTCETVRILVPAMVWLEEPYCSEDEISYLSADDISKLLNFVGGCPTCALAALKQKGYHGSMFTEFRYQEEKDKYLNSRIGELPW